MKDKEKIYEEIRRLRNGNTQERILGIECEKILSDRFSNENLEDKLNIINEKIKQYINK